MSEADVDRVVHLLAHWPQDAKYGKLTWDRLIDQLAQSGPSWTRQTLFAKSEIAEAFQQAKDELKGDARPKRKRRASDPAEALLEAKIESLKAEIDRLTQVLRDYDERFIRYQFNAHLGGVSVEKLNMPLSDSPHGFPSDGGKRRHR